jgi:hypothetical protein
MRSSILSFLYVAFVGGLAVTSACATSAVEDTESSAGAIEQSPQDRIASEDVPFVARKKATCPFVGAAVAMNKLVVRFSKNNPLANIDEIAALGTEGSTETQKSDLDKVLRLFASGNHHKMFANAEPGPSDRFDVTPPSGMFSLDFPHSQGAHPGHSGILISGQAGSYEGEFNRSAYDRFRGFAVERGGRKLLLRSAIGKFIWDNVKNKRGGDTSHFGSGLTLSLAEDLGKLVVNRDIDALVALTGSNHIVGSAGEFALLMTILEQPEEVDGEPAIDLDDVDALFLKQTLPPIWNSRPNTSIRWAHHTTALTLAAAKAKTLDILNPFN